jgi:hypothetical protein
MARYRRGHPRLEDDLAAAAVSLVVGVGAALASYYVVSLLLSREEGTQRALPGAATAAGTLAQKASNRTSAGGRQVGGAGETGSGDGGSSGRAG